MTSEEFREYAKVMKEYGISKLKMRDVEMEMPNNYAASTAASPSVPIDSPSEASSPIEHKIEQVTSLLKMNDMDLVNTLFPDAHPEEPEAVI